jgi:glycosyltransferase involved in cell wall biosynthesis
VSYRGAGRLSRQVPKASVTGADRRTLVSVCIPVFNGGDLVVRAVQSALDQDYPAVEVVVVDDASTDGTVARLRETFGNAISLFGNPVNRGQARTTNATLTRARGELLKFLHHDDWLEPQCVSRMAAALEEFPRAGFAFSRRKIEVASDTASAAAWVQRYRNVHEGFGRLEPVNSGPTLLERLLRNDLIDNWIGEPSCVMVRRRALSETGGFNPHVHGTVDLDLWARLMARFDVAFVDEELVTYRHSTVSQTAKTRSSRLDWLDRLWTLDALAHDPATGDSLELVAPRLRAERRLAFRATVLQTLRRRPHDLPLRLWWRYVGVRLARRMNELMLDKRQSA